MNSIRTSSSKNQKRYKKQKRGQYRWVKEQRARLAETAAHFHCFNSTTGKNRNNRKKIGKRKGTRQEREKEREKGIKATI
jgi:hypothetical protein